MPEKPNPAEETLKVIAYGPHGTRLGGLWTSPDDVLGIVHRLEVILNQNGAYEPTANAVAHQLGVIAVPYPEAVQEAEGDDFDPREYLDDEFTRTMESLGYRPSGQRSYSRAIHAPQVHFKVYLSGVEEEQRFTAPGEARRGPSGHLLIEARHAGWMQFSVWNPHGKSDYQTLLDHTFEHDPPTDVVLEVDRLLSNWKGTFSEIEGELTRLKSKLTALSDKAFQARRRVESLVNTLLEGDDDDFDPREYLLVPSDIDGIAEELKQNGWTLEKKDEHWGWKFWREDYRVGDISCDLVLFVIPEPPYEIMIEVFAHYLDDNGFEHRQRVDQENAWWENNPGEPVTDYVYRVLDSVSRVLKVPQFYQPD